jgi:hypothetical protein
MNVMRRPVLQLNASYEALRITTARRANRMVTIGKASSGCELQQFNASFPGMSSSPIILLASGLDIG